MPSGILSDRIVYENLRELIFPAGNEYRRMEFLSSKYNGMRVEGISYHNPYYHVDLMKDYPSSMATYEYDQDQNGRFYVACSRCDDANTEADYYIVHFTLAMPEAKGGKVYLNGDFMQNTFDANSEMVFNPDSRQYEKAILLKQGNYNYQYLYVPEGETTGQTGSIEGDFHQTENEYTIYVYFRPMGTRYDRLIDYMTNKKSDREVEIVHNRELIGGLTTHIELTGLTIDFRRLGEARTLSWQQFEECVSKYRKWFEKEIILLGAGNEELAETYAVPCQKRPGKRTITRTDLMRLGDLDVKQLEEYYNSLTAEDQHFIVSYWLGQCYSRTPKFYDRYKMETLNRLSNDGAFDNILTLMNGDYRLSQEELNGQAPQNQGGLTSANSMMNNINVIK